MIAGDYIASGILQDYCLGLLTHEDEKEVEAICQAYPQVDKELQLLRMALEKYTGSNDLAQRTELRWAVWDAIKKTWEENLK